MKQDKADWEEAFQEGGMEGIIEVGGFPAPAPLKWMEGAEFLHTCDSFKWGRYLDISL